MYAHLAESARSTFKDLHVHRSFQQTTFAEVDDDDDDGSFLWQLLCTR